MRVIGTAGHVDHGKSTLVEALTGTHPDRLKEERERQMTIDLGFAWFTLPNGEEVGIVDVPGHRDFIENMLAGVGGIDAVLFVVAADEGVMPQTREHLAIIDLLEIAGGVVVLNKIDLIDDLEWLDLVENDLRQALAGSILANAPVVRLSALNRTGLNDCIAALQECLSNQPARANLGKPRLPVDRVFTLAGFGTIVTGTLMDGEFHLGDEVELYPTGLRGRVRGLQSHKRKQEVATPGSRTAVNISGIPVEQIQRGNVLARPGDYLPTRSMDVRFRLLPDASSGIKHNTLVKLFLGSAEILARCRLLGCDELHPGEQGWLQLELSEPVVAVRGDHYILRRPSPGETLGGGKVVDPHPTHRHKRFSTQVLSRLESLSHGTPAEILLQSLLTVGVVQLKDLLTHSHLEADSGEQAVHELLSSGLMVNLDSPSAIPDSSPPSFSAPAIKPGDLVTSHETWENAVRKAIAIVDDYHRASPLAQGIPREELKSRLIEHLRIPSPLAGRFFNLALRRLVEAGELVETGSLVHRPGHAIRFNTQQQASIDRLLNRFAMNPYTPPSPKECQEEVGGDVYQALLDLGELVAVSPEVVFRKKDYALMVDEIRRLLRDSPLSAAQVRDHFKTSRKYTLALLEHLDAIGITIREGDLRRLRSP